MENREEVGWNTEKGIAGIQGEGWIEYREKDECNTGRRLGGIQGEGLIHYMNKDRIQKEYMEKV